MILDHRTWVVTALGVAQTLAWASSYYLPAILASPMARDLGVSTPTAFAAFSAALILSAVIGPRAGRAIDLWGGRPVLMITNVVFATGLVVLASAHGVVVLFIGWLIIGIGMGSGLYEAAFSALVRFYGHDARGPITGVTLLAGFANTVGRPRRRGWRRTSAGAEHVSRGRRCTSGADEGVGGTRRADVGRRSPNPDRARLNDDAPALTVLARRRERRSSSGILICRPAVER